MTVIALVASIKLPPYLFADIVLLPQQGHGTRKVNAATLWYDLWHTGLRDTADHLDDISVRRLSTRTHTPSQAGYPVDHSSPRPTRAIQTLVSMVPSPSLFFTMRPERYPAR